MSEAAMQTEISQYVERSFGVFADLLRLQVCAHPEKLALICGNNRVTYSQLDELADRIAAGLQRADVEGGSTVAICADASIAYVAVFIAVLRTGAAVSPLSPSATSDQLLAMLRDSGARHLFLDAVGAEALGSAPEFVSARRIAIEGGASGEPLELLGCRRRALAPRRLGSPPSNHSTSSILRALQALPRA